MATSNTTTTTISALVPPYSLWVQGDNTLSTPGKKPYDSTTHGPVSKKLLIGIVDFIVWPPSRFGQVQRGATTEEQGA